VLPGLAAAIMAVALPAVPSRFVTLGVIPPNVTPLRLADRIVTPALVVSEVLSCGAAIASLGLLLAIWIHRPGRAIAASVTALVLFAFGWLMVLESLIWPALQAWALARYGLTRMDLNWLNPGLATLSPLIGPAITLDGLGESRYPQWKF